MGRLQEQEKEERRGRKVDKSTGNLPESFAFSVNVEHE